jgi:ATP-dependent Clp protease ATP-binding subunit ClpA
MMTLLAGHAGRVWPQTTPILQHVRLINLPRGCTRHCMLSSYCLVQILGRNLEALVGRSQELKEEMKDDFVSVEHLLLAFLDDSRFGANVLATEALDKAKIQEAVKQVGNESLGRYAVLLDTIGSIQEGSRVTPKAAPDMVML